MIFPVLSAVVIFEQLDRNAVYSRAGDGYAASGHRAGRSGLLQSRFAPHYTVPLSAQSACSQDDIESRPRFT